MCLTSKWGNVDNLAPWSLKPCNIALHPTQRVKLRAVGAGNRGSWGHQLQGRRISNRGECVTVGNQKANQAAGYTFPCKQMKVPPKSQMPRNQVQRMKLVLKLGHQPKARAGMRHSIEYVDDGGYFRIRPRLEFGARCFDNGNSTTVGAPIFQWQCHHHPNQQWSAWSPRNGEFNIRNRKSGMCMGRGKGNKLFQVRCNAQDGRQRFRLIR